MRIARPFFALIPAIIFSAAVSFASPIGLQQDDQNAQTIEMTAKKYEFNPSPVHVKQGTRVRLKITTLDRAHGVKFSLYPDGVASKGDPGLVFTGKQDCFKVDKDSPAVVEFVAHTAGTYSFKCCVHCGLGHGHMKGQLIVDP